MLSRQRFLLLVTGVTVFFLIAGAYFIARAIRGDLAVARLQSGILVSHEFRSPLTSIRQLSEISPSAASPTGSAPGLCKRWCAKPRGCSGWSKPC